MKKYLIGILFILASCNGQKKVNGKNVGTPVKTDTSLVLLIQDEHSGFEVAETMVIRDHKRLKSLFSRINHARKPGLPLPEVDFSKEVAVLQCSGEQEQIGIPTLTFHRETVSEIVLRSKLIKNTGKPSKVAISYPFCLYKMPLTDKEIVVKRSKLLE